MGRLLQILLRPSARTPTRSVEAAEAVVGSGLVGDHAGGRRRQVTLLSLEAWQAACAELGQVLDPAIRRANLVLEGIDLAKTRGRRLRLGSVVLEIQGELRPCLLLDDHALGLDAALRRGWRGGVHAAVITPGTLHVGDAVAWEPSAEGDAVDRAAPERARAAG